MLGLKGTLSIEVDGHFLGGRERIELLARIGESGSISAAARAVGMSYKGAWDAVEAMNNLAGEPLVSRAVGGRRGGGTQLTDRARRLIEVYRAMETAHQQFIRQLGGPQQAAMGELELVKRLMIRTSARNQLVGAVVAVEPGSVNDLIHLEIQGGQRIVATVTRDSTRTLGLAPGKEAMALIKASSVLIGLPGEGLRLSARNQLAGKVSKVVRGAVNAEVSIQLQGGNVVVATITNASTEALALAEGVEVLAIIKASSIIIGTMD
ncbi:LysR family transcriptional regulator [Dyella solisilvae]|uniref:LysR family transcriptional regulator n=2 Tax=Dyella solisilvae TaxID=1920168 RepID=A0A370K923_9GAMM|nr:LysR family transcriptional regulator [Dyella solisilvae]